MTRIAWGTPGLRFFESGVDRGVLYLENESGVPWSGLTSVNEAPDGGAPRPYYIDGEKYLNIAASEEYKATISALSAPMEFGVCDGMRQLHNGLLVTQQPRQPFGFSYRTLIGNDQQGTDFGYKLHLIYNALAAPASKNNETVSTGVKTLGLSWNISTLAPRVNGIRSTAHIVIDSRLTPMNLIREVENILYGTDDEDARLPSISELITLFEQPGPISRINYVRDPLFKAPTQWGSGGGNLTFPAVDGVVEYTATQSIAGVTVVLGNQSSYTGFVEAGDWGAVSFYVENASAIDIPVRACLNDGVVMYYGPTVLIPAGESRYAGVGNQRMTFDSVMMQPRLHLAAGFALPVGSKLRISEPIVETKIYTGKFFSGDTPNTQTDTYSWEGAVNASWSILRSWA